MPRVKLVPGLWGSLTPAQPLSDDQITDVAQQGGFARVPRIARAAV